MGRTLMGFESEYGYVAIGRDGRRMEHGMDHLEDLARRTEPYLPAEDRGMFLRNGSLFYRDPGSGGAHLEIATAEVSSPTDVVLYARAGDRFIADLAERYTAEDATCAQSFVLRSNVDYSADPGTWGSHESFMTRTGVADMAGMLIGHLVSRQIYTGAGGFNARAPGLEFMLSPRAAFLHSVVGSGNESDRPILHTRDEAHASACHRLHITSGDGLNSQRALWLRFATTSLIAAMIDAGHTPGSAAGLVDPVRAIRAFASDPSLQAVAQCRDGKARTALALQWHYLVWVEARVGDGFMPPWAEEGVREWRRMLLRLEAGGAKATERTLDWAIKHGIYTERLRRREWTWAKVEEWNARARRVQHALGGDSPEEDGCSIFTTEDLDDAELADKLQQALEREGVSREEMRAFLKMRAEFCEIDTSFSRLDARGLFNALDRGGHLDHRVPGIDERLEHAREFPPADTRARLRGELVRTIAGSRHAAHYRVGWATVFDTKGNRRLDLSNPFATELNWRPVPAPRGTDLLETLERMRDSHEVDALPAGQVAERLETAWEAYRHGDYTAAQTALERLEAVLTAPSEQRESYRRLMRLVRCRRGEMEGRRILERMAGGTRPTLVEMADLVCVLRYQGFTPPPEFDDALRRTRHSYDAAATPPEIAATLLDHEASALLRRGHPIEALHLLERAAGLEQPDPRIQGRMLADRAEACRMLGRLDAARAHLDAAEAILRPCQGEGERIESVFLVRAKVEAATPPIALALLDPAVVALRHRGAATAHVRARMLRARIARDITRSGEDWPLIPELCMRTPALAHCPLALRILRNWDAWVAGRPSPEPHPDTAFWGV